LKNEERPRISAAMPRRARTGDLSENAEYDAARDRQGLVEARIRDIEAKLANAQVVDPKTLHAEGRVVFAPPSSSRAERRERDLRSSARTRPTSGKAASPSARPSRAPSSGKHAGDAVDVQTPGRPQAPTRSSTSAKTMSGSGTDSQFGDGARTQECSAMEALSCEVHLGMEVLFSLDDENNAPDARRLGYQRPQKTEIREFWSSERMRKGILGLNPLAPSALRPD